MGIFGYRVGRRSGNAQNAGQFFGTLNRRTDMNPKIKDQRETQCCNICEIVDLIPTLTDHDLNLIRMTAESEQQIRKYCGVKRDS